MLRRLETTRTSWVADRLLSVAAPIAGALLLWTAFPPHSAAWAAWIALAPIAMLMRSHVGAATVYGGAFVGGALFHFCALDFMRTTLSAGGLLGPMWKTWVLLALVGGASWILTLWIGRRLSLRRHAPLAAALPLAWIGGELFRRYSTFLLDGTGFPLLEIGMTQIDSPYVVQIASVAGVGGVSLLIAFISGVIADALSNGPRRWKRTAIEALCGCALIAGTVGFGWIALDRSIGRDIGPLVCVGHLSVPKNGAEAADLRAALGGEVDLIVFPEAAIAGTIVEFAPTLTDAIRARRLREIQNTCPLGDRDDVEFDRRWLQSIAQALDCSLAVGCHHAVAGADRLEIFNAVAVVDAQGGVRCYDKVSLAPGGDFVPYPLDLLGVIPTDVAFESVPRLEDPTWTRPVGFDRGRNYPIFNLPLGERAIPFAASICYDGCFPSVFRRLLRGEHPPVFFVQAAYEGADASGVGAQFLLAMARMRAIEFGRAIARTSSGGPSCIIDPHGQVLLAEQTSSGGILVGQVPVEFGATIYMLVGDGVLFACLASLGIGCVLFPR